MEENEISKEMLEKEKLKCEITEYKKPWFKKPVNLFPIFTFLIALGTLIWSFASGILNTQFQNLTLEKNILQFDIRQFNLQRDVLLKQNKDLKDSLLRVHESLEKAEVYYLTKYEQHKKSVIDSLSKFNPEQLCSFYKLQLDSLSKILLKRKSIEKVLTTETGEALTTEDGKTILF